MHDFFPTNSLSEACHSESLDSASRDNHSLTLSNYMISSLFVFVPERLACTDLQSAALSFRVYQTFGMSPFVSLWWLLLLVETSL